MKIGLFTIFALMVLSSVAFGQSEAQRFKTSELKKAHLSGLELKDKFVDKDFSQLWTKTENKFIYGFIGDNYQRVRIKFISVTKDSAGDYSVYGKSMVKNNICVFKGSLKVTNIRKSKETVYGVDDEYKNKHIIGQYTIIGDYYLAEDKKQAYVGAFNGSFKTEFYLTKDHKIHYDDIESNADGYSNNEFVGTWVSYNKATAKRCNWGDFRIPNSGNFDVGAAELSPTGEYLPFGWQTLRDAVSTNQASTKALKEENRIWWK